MDNSKFFDFSNFKGDVLGGITAGIVALPLALAFGVSSGLGPTAGVYGAIFLGFFAALFGGTPTQISGPTAPVTAVSMAVIAGIVATYDGNVSAALPAILSVFFMAGVIQVLMGVTKVGMYIKYIPYPVVSGFMTAIGLIIIITQLLPILGYTPKNDAAFVDNFRTEARATVVKRIVDDEVKKNSWSLQALQDANAKADQVAQEEVDKQARILATKYSGGVIGTIKALPSAIKNIRWLEVILALSTIAIVYGFKKITTAVPSTLAALIIVSLVAWLGGFDYLKIDEIPGGIPLPHIELFTGFDFNLVSPYIFTALTIAMLGAIDSLLTSVVADNMTKTKHNPNKELFGQGIGNAMAAFFGGLPGAGATIRTVVNINSGGRTKISGMTAAVLLLVIILALAPVASKIPAAVLAGILFTVGVGVMDYKGLRAIPSMPKDFSIGPLKLSSEVIIMVIVMLLSTFWNLVYAVGIGMVFAALIFMKKMGDLTAKKSTVSSINELPGETQYADDLDFPANLKEEVFVKRLNGPLFFGVTDEVKELAQQLPETARYFVIRMDNVPYVDQSGVYALEDIIHGMESKGIETLLVNVQPQVDYMLNRIKIIPDLVSNDNVFKNFSDCLIWIKKNVEDTHP